MFFLSETHLGKAKAENLKRRLGCDHYIIHKSDGRSGGLLMLWRKEVVDNIPQQSYYLDLNVAVLIADHADNMEEQISISFVV